MGYFDDNEESFTRVLRRAKPKVELDPLTWTMVSEMAKIRKKTVDQTVNDLITAYIKHQQRCDHYKGEGDR